MSVRYVISGSNTRSFLNKNIEAENGSNIKNILRICSASAVPSRSENCCELTRNLRTVHCSYLALFHHRIKNSVQLIYAHHRAFVT